MARLLAAANWTRAAGRATLVAIWLASLEARTRVEAIVMIEGILERNTGVDVGGKAGKKA